jgi:hypothetical protein
VLTSSDGDREFVYIIEEHDAGHPTVLVPWAFAGLAGSVKIVDGKCVELLDANTGDILKVLSYCGVESQELLDKKMA